VTWPFNCPYTTSKEIVVLSYVANPHRIAKLLQQNFLVLALLTGAGLVLWAAGWEVIGILLTVVGGIGLFWGLVAAAFVTESYGPLDNDGLRLSKDEARPVTLIRDKNIDPSTIIARIQDAK
jgi:hypothetical protein